MIMTVACVNTNQITRIDKQGNTNLYANINSCRFVGIGCSISANTRNWSITACSRF